MLCPGNSVEQLTIYLPVRRGQGRFRVEPTWCGEDGMELPVPTEETDAFVDAAMGQLLWQEPQKLGWWVPFKIQILRLAR